ncbi:MAG: lamin tail domain-containing protein [Verrucomicrobiales bacterium]|nr:lamin tail domain-containing protein [Verrucomicrobiales bacterium]
MTFLDLLPFRFSRRSVSRCLAGASAVGWMVFGAFGADPAPTCRPLREGASAWFPAESTENVLGSVPGTFLGDARLGAGRTGQAFLFDGLDDVVSVPSTPGLELQDLTIECWIRRGDFAKVGNESVAVLMAGNRSSWVFGIAADGSLFLGKVGVGNSGGRPAVTDTQWHHVAVTRQGAAVRFFVDGADAGEATQGEVFGGSATYGIGGLSERFDNITYGFLGSIDDVTVYRRALSPTEIADEARAVLPRCLEDVQLVMVSSPKVVSQKGEWSVVAEVRNRSSQTAQGLKIRVESHPSMEFLGAVLPQGSVGAEGPLQLQDLPPGESSRLTLRWRAGAGYSGWATNRLILEPNAADQVLLDNEGVASLLVVGECVDPLPSAVGWWPAEDSAQEVFSGITGNLTSTVAYVPGIRGKAFSFRRNLEVMTFPLQAAFWPGDFTIECWMRRESLTSVSPTGNHTFFIGGPVSALGFGIVPDGRLYLHKIGTDSIFSTATILDTQWHHVAVTRSGLEIRFFIDGADSGSSLYAGTFVRGEPVTLGGVVGFGDTTYTFLGDLDEVTIHSRALTAGQVAQVAAAGANGNCAPDLTLETSAVPSRVVVDDPFDVVFQVNQAGARPSTDSQFVMVLPPGVEFVSATTGQGVASETAGVIRCVLGTLDRGAVVPITVRLRARNARDYRLDARVQSPDEDIAEENNRVEFRVSAGDFQLTVDAVSADEGPAGSQRTMEFLVHFNPSRFVPVQLSFASSNLTATAGRDYSAAAGELVVPAGASEAVVSVTILGDAAYEDTEELLMTVTSVSPGPVRSASAIGTLRNDDLAPVLRIQAARWAESDLPVNPVAFDAELVGASELPARFRWTVVGREAREGSDFGPASGVAELHPGQQRVSLPLDILGDNVFEGDETLLLRISEATGCRPVAEVIRGILVDDDTPSNVPVSFTVEPGVAVVEPGKGFPATITARSADGSVLDGFDGAVSVLARGGSGVPSRIIISEVTAADAVGGDFVEVVNVSPDVVDLSGWRLLLFGPGVWPDPALVVTVPEGTRLAKGGTLVLHQWGLNFVGSVSLAGFTPPWSGNTAADLFGQPLIAVLVQDPSGATEDVFLAGGASAEFMASGVGVGDPRWQGPAVEAASDRPFRFQRKGNVNTRTASDWVIQRPSTPGIPASDLILPFADAVPVGIQPGTVRGFVHGVWQGTLTLSDPVIRAALFVDDGNGHFGRSGFFTTQSDLDGDGLPDTWEISWGLSYRDPADAGADLDGDGYSALQEWTAGTNPREASSALRLRISRDRIAWSAEAGRRYRLESRARFGAGDWGGLKTWEPAEAQQISEPVVSPESEAARLYRVVVEVP